MPRLAEGPDGLYDTCAVDVDKNVTRLSLIHKLEYDA